MPNHTFCKSYSSVSQDFDADAANQGKATNSGVEQHQQEEL